MFGKIIIQFILFFKIFVKKMNGCLFWKGVFNIIFFLSIINKKH
jgi:hypothetical protein